MSNSNNIITQISGLDFDDIKDNLIAYLRNQDEFKDYNFEGSNLSQLLNILAYNTHYDAFLLNMQASEMTLANTTKRISTVDRAKQIGYVPRSTRSASSFLDIEVFTTDPLATSVFFTSGYIFQTEILGQSYIFQTTRDYFAERDVNDRIIIPNVEIVEGRKFTHRFTIDNQNIGGIIIPNKNVDTSRLTITVKPSPTSTDQVVYQAIENIVDVDAESTVYFLEETDNLRHKISFGDGVIGKAIEVGNQVIVEYFVSSGVAANSASVFEPSSVISGVDEIEILSSSPASGGSDIETVSSVKTSAPLAYQTQNRAVTFPDYTSVVKRVFPDVDTLNVWGGEDNVPIALGYVFISIKPSGRNFLNQAEKFNIENELKRRFSIIAIEPVIVDPEFIFLEIDTKVKIKDGSNVSGVTSAVRNAILNYSNTELGRFNEFFRYSKFVRVIDGASSNITNSLTGIRLISEKFVVFDSPDDIIINFTQKIDPESFNSDTFLASVGMVEYPNAFYVGRDDWTVDLVEVVSGVETIISPEVGTITEEGIVTLSNVATSPDLTLTGRIKFTAEPIEFDVIPVRNTLVSIREQDVFIELVASR